MNKFSWNHMSGFSVCSCCISEKTLCSDLEMIRSAIILNYVIHYHNTNANDVAMAFIIL